MEKTDAGTSVGVADPYAQVDRCDHLTDEGRCRFAVEQGDRDPTFAAERRRDEYRCPVVAPPDDETPVTVADGDGSALDGEWDWADCEHFRCRNHDRECARCGLDEVRMAHDDDRPLLEEHHVSYSDDSAEGAGDPGHEITIYLCRWCHAKVHKSWAAVEDDVNPDPEAIAAREERRSKEQRELGFESASERFED
ncbi:hypothetical protein ACKVMT_15925 [Halobacteriales archaeon Cl-PHB]